jgi:hypothetical protein
MIKGENMDDLIKQSEEFHTKNHNDAVVEAPVKHIIRIEIHNRCMFRGCYDGTYDWKLIGEGETLKEAVLNAINNASYSLLNELEIESVDAYDVAKITYGGKAFYGEEKIYKVSKEEVIDIVNNSKRYKEILQKRLERKEKETKELEDIAFSNYKGT